MKNLYIENKTRTSRQASLRSDNSTLISLTHNFKPFWPRKKTLAYSALTLMLQGNVLTHLDFIISTGSWRLAAHIFTLKNLGWPIKTEVMTCIPYGHFRARTINRYFFDSDILEVYGYKGEVL